MTLPPIDRRLIGILALAAFFIFFRISHVDMTGDDAVYSVRSVGLVDFMFGDFDFQSTPLTWFSAAPWWTRLSFHDHPLLLFFIQWVFLFGTGSLFSAKLPFALMVIGAIVLTYAWTARQYSRDVARFSALLLALNAQVIWAGRVTYLEGGVLFFLSLATYCFFRFLEDRSWWWAFGLTSGLALSAKFTTLFLVPTVLVYLLAARREVFRSAALYGAGIIAFMVLAPTLVYNLAMYQTRGHFSLQFARALGQDSPWGFPSLQESGASGLHGVAELFLNIGQFISWPYLAAVVAAAAYLARKKRLPLFPALGILFLALQQYAIGRQGYMLAVFGLFFAPLLANAAVALFERRLMRAAFGALAVFLLFFVANSHVAVEQRGPVGWARSAAVSQNYGLAQLDAYLENLLATRHDFLPYDLYWLVKERDPRLKRFQLEQSFAPLAGVTKEGTVILYDGDLSWSARLWLFERRRFYENLPFFSTNEDHLLRQIRLTSFYFIRATDAAALDPAPYRLHQAAAVEALCQSLGIEPELIRRDDGAVAFKVYYVPPEKLSS